MLIPMYTPQSSAMTSRSDRVPLGKQPEQWTSWIFLFEYLMFIHFCSNRKYRTAEGYSSNQWLSYQEPTLWLLPTCCFGARGWSSLWPWTVWNLTVRIVSIILVNWPLCYHGNAKRVWLKRDSWIDKDTYVRISLFTFHKVYIMSWFQIRWNYVCQIPGNIGTS